MKVLIVSEIKILCLVGTYKYPLEDAKGWYLAVSIDES